jgi:hypothetical protein
VEPALDPRGVEGAPDGIVTVDVDLGPLYNQDVEDAGDPSSAVTVSCTPLAAATG